MKQNKLIIRVKRAELINVLDELANLGSDKLSTKAVKNNCPDAQEFLNEFIQKMKSCLLPSNECAPDRYILYLDAGSLQRYNKRKQQLSQRLVAELTKYILANGYTMRRSLEVGFALANHADTFSSVHEVSSDTNNAYGAWLEIHCEFSRSNSQLSPDGLKSLIYQGRNGEHPDAQTSSNHPEDKPARDALISDEEGFSSSPPAKSEAHNAAKNIEGTTFDETASIPSTNILASLITAKETHHLTKPKTSIGRREENDIVVSDLTVSRNHAEIIADAGKFILKDLSSKNGTYLNGERIEVAEIKNNDIISLDRAGKISFRFEMAEQYAVISSENFLEHFNRGLALRREKRWDSAAKEFLEAIRLGDKSARPYFNIAVIKFHQGDYEQSIENFQKGIAIEPDNASAYADLGKVYQITEQWEKAIEHFQKALEFKPNHEAAKRRLSRIEEVYEIYQDAKNLGLSAKRIETNGQLRLTVDSQLDKQKSESQEIEVKSSPVEPRLYRDETPSLEDDFSFDLMVGAEVQRRLMPEVPKFPELDIAAYTIPARGVSGDYYDFVPLDSQKLWLVIADVSGKSIGGAILMSEARSILRANIKHGLPLEAVISQVNNTIYEDTASDKFITMFVGTLDLLNKTFEYCNAGHNPTTLYRSQSQQLRTLDVGGPAAGILPDAPYETARVNLESGDALMFYTDGITEAMNTAEELFGEERLHQLFTQNASLEAQQIIEVISNQVKEFSAGDFEDDATLLVVKVKK
ncbi:MAG: SpoIIE family protein phosphatase [Candidatus Poribacteria bacterium]